LLFVFELSNNVNVAGCWHRDPHGLPWIDYLHSGACKIWYGIPDDHSLAFYTAMKQVRQLPVFTGPFS
jgi:hypothetical protein